MKDIQPPSNYRVSIKVIVRGPGGKVLLVKEGEDAWGIPGGGLDHGETIEQGLRREVQEEIGAEVATISELPLLVAPYYHERLNRWRLWLLYEVTLATQPEVGSHSTAIGWFDKLQFPDLDLDTSEREAMLEIFDRFVK